MPSIIKVLTDHTINKIAAGEVIENPASVVKELVENALDAGASDICVEIKGGGRQLIRISDDGCGMGQDDALLSLERHATSKIQEVEDIHTIGTMGFRGEAIPSIASISEFSLITCKKSTSSEPPPKEAPLGTLITVIGGKITGCSPVARSFGTTVEVKSLFFNVPVRKKFLKSPAVDTNEILKMVSQIALGYPHVKFRLQSDGKNILMTPPCQKMDFQEALRARIEGVLGVDYLEHTLPLNYQSGEIHLQGVIGNPSYTRHNRTGQYLFINSRGVFSPLVAYATKEGYGTALPMGRHPVFVLHLSINGSLVDVNVHPQKREVRLRQEPLIKDLIIKSVEQALQHTSFSTANHESPQVSPVFARSFSLQDAPEKTTTDDKWAFGKKMLTPWNQTNETANASVSEPNGPRFPLPKMETELPIHVPMQETVHQENSPSLPFAVPEQQAEVSILATIPGYILMEASEGRAFGFESPGKDGLILIDQKGAHARVIYERLQQNKEALLEAGQLLLIPYQLEVSSFETELLQASLPYLNNLGIGIHEFGANTFLIDAVPQVFGTCDLKELVTDILHALREVGVDSPFDGERHKQIALAASRAAISLSTRLGTHEAKTLIKQLRGCKHPFQCPRGKSTWLRLSSDALAKQFQRF